MKFAIEKGVSGNLSLYLIGAYVAQLLSEHRLHFLQTFALDNADMSNHTLGIPHIQNNACNKQIDVVIYRFRTEFGDMIRNMNFVMIIQKRTFSLTVRAVLGLRLVYSVSVVSRQHAVESRGHSYLIG